MKSCSALYINIFVKLNNHSVQLKHNLPQKCTQQHIQTYKQFICICIYILLANHVKNLNNSYSFTIILIMEHIIISGCPLQFECNLIDYQFRVWSNNDKRHLIYFQI